MRLSRSWYNTRTADTQPAEEAHASHASLIDPVDPGYWPRALGLRVVIASTYFVLIPAGLLPMSTTWWMVSGGGLLLYSFAMFSVFMRWPGAKWVHMDLCPYLDALFITLAVIAVADTNYPIWIGYFLVIMSLSTFHETRYVLAYSIFAIAMFWAGIFLAHEVGRADLNVRISLVASIMAVFTALNCDVISTSNRKLRELVLDSSLTDPLTGLQNRRRFREILDSHSVPGRPLAVIMYDIDNFKSINETMGHVHADGVLVRIGNELKRCFRDADSVARYGGDEMIVLAHVETVEDAVAMSERSLEQIRSRVGIELSAGVAVYPISTDSLEDAVRAADDALGRAKRTGKARVTVAPARAAA
jgi:diguanylate cyclase (GGDEF)-like protein